MSSLAALGGSGANVSIAAGTALDLSGFAVDAAALARVTPASTGVIGTGANITTGLDMTGLNARLGANIGGDYTFAGTLTPNGNTYRVGGGGGKLRFNVANTFTDSGGARALDINTSAVLLSPVVIGAANSYTGGTTITGWPSGYDIELEVQNAGGLGTGPITYNGGEMIYNGNNAAVSWTVGNSFTLQTGKTSQITVTQPTSFTGGFTIPSGATMWVNRFNSSPTPHLLIFGAPTTGAGNLAIHRGAMAISNTNQLPSGNLDLGFGGGGVLVLDGVTWAQFNLNRANGFGAGAAQWQATTGGLAVRSMPLVIDSAGIPGVNVGASDYTDTGGKDVRSYFDGNIYLGSALTKDGALFANAPVTVAINTILTDRRSWYHAVTGPGMTGAHTAGVVYTVTGNVTDERAMGIGILRRGCLYFPAGGNGEMVLAGLNTWTGSGFIMHIDGPAGGYSHGFNTGPGGYISGREGSNDLLRFDGGASLPTGNAGATAYLAGVGKGTKGFLLTNRVGGEAYELASGMKFVLGADNNGVFGSSGLLGTSATLRNSDICIDSAYPVGHASDVTKNLNLLVRGGELHLGAAAKPVYLIPTYGVESDNTDDGINSAATPLFNSTASGRTLTTQGAGTLVLDNVAYTRLDRSTDASSQFSWILGTATGNVFNGAVRQTGSTSATSITGMSNFRLKMQGGVLELGGGDLVANLGTGTNQIDMSGTAGGGFSAYGARRTVTLNSGADVTWGAGSFVNSGQPLILGSTTANNTAVLANNIDLVTATRTVAVIRGLGTTPEGELAGALRGVGGLTVAGLNAPNGTALPTGTLVLSGNNSYTGATSVNAGTLRLTGQLTSAVTVAASAAFTGTGKTTGAIAGAGLVAPGTSPGILTVGSVNPTTGMDFAFEFTALGSPTYGNATASANDLLRITGTTPFSAALTSANTAAVYLDVAGFYLNDTFRGGFFTTSDVWTSMLQNGGWTFYQRDSLGAVAYGGKSYSPLGGAFSVTSSMFAESADFGAGQVSGYVAQFQVVPEPATGFALALAALSLLAARRRTSALAAGAIPGRTRR